MSWAIVLCRFRDVLTETQPLSFFQDFFTKSGAGTEGAFDYWRDVSNGLFVNDSEVFGSFEIPHDSTEIAGGLNRAVYQQWGVDAAVAHNVPLNRFPRRIFFFNANGDHGAAGGGTTVFSYAPGRPLEPTFMFHEMGHTLGLGHSFSDSPSPCCGGGQAGEYCDGWDIMSAMCVFQFPGRQGQAGPGLSAPHLQKLGWLDPARLSVASNRGTLSYDVQLVPLSLAQLPGLLAARVDYVDEATGDQMSYFVELRAPSQWDRGVPHAAVLIHRLENGRSVLVGSGRSSRPNLDWKPGDRFEDSLNKITISVTSVDAVGQRAKIAITGRAGWTDYIPLANNPILGEPAASSWGQNRIDVFVRGTHDTLCTKSWVGTRWTDYVQLGTNPISAGIAACSWGPNRIDVFVRGTDDTLSTKSWDGARWSDYAQLGTNEIWPGIAACSWGPGRIDVFVWGTDHRLYTKSWVGTRWTDYVQLGRNSISAGIAACSWGPNRIDVFVRGTDNTLYTKSWVGTRWTDYVQLGTNPISPGIAACSWGPNRIDVFVRGTDDTLYTKSWVGTHWTDYVQLGTNSISAGPAACAWGPNRIDVFVRGTDNALYSKSWVG